MNDESKVFGSGELTPDFVRSARFDSVGNGYAPEQVREFLEQVASAVEVLQSSDVTESMRRELQRNVDISSRMIAAGQETSTRLREQAAVDAREIIEDTKRIAEQLRDRAREEVGRTQQHIEQLRLTFIDELRDMYDRIGASLYRFESASEVVKLAEQLPAVDTGAWLDDVQGASTSGAAPSGDTELPSQVQAPAYTQLESGEVPAGGYEFQNQAADVGWEHDSQIPSADDFLAPGEPLVDLRGLRDVPQMPVVDPIEPELDVEHEFELESGAATVAPDDVNEYELEVEPTGGDGGWLIDDDQPIEPEQPIGPEQVEVGDDTRAEALLAGMDQVLSSVVPPSAATSPTPAELPQPPSLAPTSVAAAGESVAPEIPQADLEAISSYILQAIHEGSSRETIELYLRDNLGLANAAQLIDHTLAGPGA